MTNPINNRPEQPTKQASETDDLDADSLLLLNVDFKWLMAGIGWWVDTTRIHSDSSYASKCLNSAMASESLALRKCATQLFGIHPAARLAATDL